MTRLCVKLGSLHAVLTPHGLYSFRRNFIPFWPSLHSSFLIHTQRKTVSLAKKLWRLHKDYDLIKCWLAHTKLLILVQTVLSILAVNDRKYVFHFRLKPKPKLEKHLAFGRIPKPKPRVQIYVKKGGILLKFNVSNDLSN